MSERSTLEPLAGIIRGILPLEKQISNNYNRMGVLLAIEESNDASGTQYLILLMNYLAKTV